MPRKRARPPPFSKEAGFVATAKVIVEGGKLPLSDWFKEFSVWVEGHDLAGFYVKMPAEYV